MYLNNKESIAQKKSERIFIMITMDQYSSIGCSWQHFRALLVQLVLYKGRFKVYPGMMNKYKITDFFCNFLLLKNTLLIPLQFYRYQKITKGFTLLVSNLAIAIQRYYRDFIDQFLSPAIKGNDKHTKKLVLPIQKL